MKDKSDLDGFGKPIIPEEAILRAVAAYVPLDHLAEARSLYREAQSGNKVAQFIVGMALRKRHHQAAAEIWLRLSAAQDFEPAKQQLKRVS